MKILVINKFYWLQGGSERYMFDSIRDLEANGHTVIPFSMIHDRNVPSPYSGHFVSNIAYKDVSPLYKLRKAPKIVAKTVYSFEARRRLESLIRETKPDIAHVHMVFHQISPSIFDSLRKYNIPTVQTLHNYKVVCPSADLYINHKYELCERCLTGRYVNCVRHRCIKGSLPASALAAGAMYLHRRMAIYERGVDIFLTSTKFLRNKIVEGGLPPEKVKLCPLTIDLSRFEPRHEVGEYFLFYGRFVRQKGIHTLVRAAKACPDARILIVGDGEEKESLDALVKSEGVQNVEFLGFKTGEDLERVIAGALCIVIPSEWYETCGLVIYEAYAMGKPVIGASIGAIPEAIEVGKTGYLFEPGNADQLADRMTRLLNQRDDLEEMGRLGRSKVEELCAGHYDRLMAKYDEARSIHAKH